MDAATGWNDQPHEKEDDGRRGMIPADADEASFACHCYCDSQLWKSIQRFCFGPVRGEDDPVFNLSAEAWQ